ncbi:MAG: hypothetical protein VKJ04_01790 [Vampirovibrionales bacterium]|nr:hypothetical protein [Vampirovibrionales bacterium]
MGNGQKQEQLVELCYDFGFSQIGKRPNGEDVYCKNHPAKPPSNTVSPLEYHRLYAPHFKYGNDVGKFVVPIQPAYHDKLFPDCYPTRQQSLFGLNEGQIVVSMGENIPGNAIKQAYLSHAPIKMLKPGDLLLFYRSHDFREATTIGVVESAEHLTGSQKVMERVSKRTVYNSDEIENMSQRPCLTILFRLAGHIRKPVSSDVLGVLGINGPIQSIRSIDDAIFREIIVRGGIQNCVYAN